MMRKWLTGMALVVVAAMTTSGQAAESEMRQALNDGAKRLTSDEIAARFVGHTLTWVSADGSKKALIHYGEDNTVAGRLVGGDWTGSGFYGVANDDRICLSWDKRDKGRLRCLYVLVVDGTVRKYRADGSLSGDIVAFEEGRAF